jgi:hypothetical protein
MAILERATEARCMAVSDKIPRHLSFPLNCQGANPRTDGAPSASQDFAAQGLALSKRHHTISAEDDGFDLEMFVGVI